MVCAINALADKIKDDGFDAVTMYTLLGRSPIIGAVDEDVTFMPFDVKPYNVTLLEKIFINTVWQLE